jgi:hypothetical protein
MKHKSEKGGMRSAKMPSEHFEKSEGELAHECKEKYATEFGNPASLDKMTSGLANYAKKHKMKYE